MQKLNNSPLAGPILDKILGHALEGEDGHEYTHKDRASELGQVSQAFHQASRQQVQLRPERVKVQETLKKQDRLTQESFERLRQAYPNFLGVSSFQAAQKQLDRFDSETVYYYLNDGGELIHFSSPEGTYISRDLSDEELKFLLSNAAH